MYIGEEIWYDVHEEKHRFTCKKHIRKRRKKKEKRKNMKQKYIMTYKSK